MTRTTDLRNLILKARHAYYYSNEPIMSDAEYDAIEDELRQPAPDDPVLALAGAPVQGDTMLTKARHLASNSSSVGKSETIPAVAMLEIFIQLVEQGVNPLPTERAQKLLVGLIQRSEEKGLANGEELVYPTSLAYIESPLREAVEDRFEAGVSLLLSAGDRVINDEILKEASEF